MFIAGAALLATSAAALGPQGSVFGTPMCQELKCVFKDKYDTSAYRHHPAYSQYDYRVKNYASQGVCGSDLNRLFIRRETTTMEVIDVVFSSPILDCRVSEDDFRRVAKSMLTTYVPASELRQMNTYPYKSVIDACQLNSILNGNSRFVEFESKNIRIQCNAGNPSFDDHEHSFSIHFRDEFGV